MSTSNIPNITQIHIDRFWSYVNKTSNIEDCWLWSRGTGSGGYGAFGIGSGTSYGTHRIAYYLHYNSWPGDLDVCHKCDIPLCCNPYHLFLGNAQDNANDMVRKGRFVPKYQLGEASTSVKLTDDTVRFIHMNKNLLTQKQLSEIVGVASSNISRILSGHTWPHIYKEYNS